MTVTDNLCAEQQKLSMFGNFAIYLLYFSIYIYSSRVEVILPLRFTWIGRYHSKSDHTDPCTIWAERNVDFQL